MISKSDHPAVVGLFEIRHDPFVLSHVIGIGIKAVDLSSIAFFKVAHFDEVSVSELLLLDFEYALGHF